MDGLTAQLLPLVGDKDRLHRLHAQLGDFCHAIRNRLNCIKLSMYLAKRTESTGANWEEAERRYREIEQFVETFQRICRPMVLQAMTVPLGAVLEARREAWAHVLGDRGRSFVWLPPEKDPPVALDAALWTFALDAMVSWRARMGPPNTSIRLGWCAVGRGVNLMWDEPEAAGERGWSAPAEAPPFLALALLARVAAAHEGELVPGEGPRFRFDIWIPR